MAGVTVAAGGSGRKLVLTRRVGGQPPPSRSRADQQGMTHYGSWPAGLSTPGRSVPITFAEVLVTTPGGSTTRQVVWLDCRP
jgi:hypothetical protein